MSHYYDIDGQPRHFVPKVKGDGERPTTIKDARKNGWLPSVTEILNVAAKPALTNWLVDQALLAALTLPKIEGETLDEFKKRAKADSEKQSKDAMELGNQIHADIECVFTGIPPLVHKKAAEAVRDFVFEYTGLTEGWRAEHTFGSPMGYGGMIDLYHPHGWVFDFKTKDFGPDEANKKMAYDEHCMQLSAYAYGVELPDARKMNIFVSRNNPGLISVHEWEEDMFGRFHALLMYWQLTKNYFPREERQ